MAPTAYHPNKKESMNQIKTNTAALFFFIVDDLLSFYILQKRLYHFS
ncbi:hypothetical protein [Turicimonas muris]|nr:hypothetical protein [Turicimonas muris]